jgi:HEAT repeat protein
MSSTTKILVAVLAVVSVGAVVYYCVPRTVLQRAARRVYADDAVKNKVVAAAGGESGVQTTNRSGVAAFAPPQGDATAVRSATTNSVTATAVDAAAEAVLDQIDQFIADDDLDSAYQLARTLMGHSDPEVRTEAAETFGWIGLKALTELSLMLKDADPDVAATALHNWELTIGDITDDTLKSEIVIEGVKLLQDPDDIEGIIMQLDSMEDDLAVRTVVQIIRDGTPAASEVAREHYEFMTDEPYTSPEAAEAWLKKQAD